MWGTFLSEPLSIVGLVGRYPANCLMERIPIDNRNSLIIIPCGICLLYTSTQEHVINLRAQQRFTRPEAHILHRLHKRRLGGLAHALGSGDVLRDAHAHTPVSYTHLPAVENQYATSFPPCCAKEPR